VHGVVERSAGPLSRSGLHRRVLCRDANRYTHAFSEVRLADVCPASPDIRATATDDAKIAKYDIAQP
jgi:hypothetical protein